MAEDIAPKLIEDITEEFHKLYNSSGAIQSLLKKVQQGTATYAEAQQYSLAVSRLIGKAYESHISSATLPDGKMYYNIASRLIPSTLDENYKLVSDYAVKVQQALNASAGLGLKAQTAEQNRDRVDGLVNLASNADQYDDASEKLLTAIENYSLNIVDETIKANADFQYHTGLRPKIIRKAERKCCEWCSRLAGEYDYPDVPDDIYRRHENCRCIVEYDPGDGRRQNVHTKRLTSPGEHDIIEERKRFGLGNTDTFRPKEYASTISNYAKVDREGLVAAAKERKRHSHRGVYLDAMDKSKKQLQKSIVSRVSQVERHADKIQHPEKYVPDWAKKDPRYKEGLIRKWEKDMRRNAEQAEIELAVFEERFSL